MYRNWPLLGYVNTVTYTREHGKKYYNRQAKQYLNFPDSKTIRSLYILGPKRRT